MISRNNTLYKAKTFWICFALSFLLLMQTASASEKNSVYHCHENKEKKIALTFDDGPHPILTSQILDILQKYQVKATFFVVGENVKNYPDVVERIVKEGHEIGNHTFSHDKIDRNEVEDCENAIYELTEHKTRLFRPPEGHLNHVVKNMSSSLGYDIILWDIDTKDWNHSSSTDIYNNVKSHVRSGSIILMHDYIGYKSPTPKALESILPELLSEGYQFVVVSELIGTF